MIWYIFHVFVIVANWDGFIVRQVMAKAHFGELKTCTY
jgi:hypothetical protein